MPSPLPDVAAFLAMVERLGGPTSRTLGPAAARKQMRDAIGLVDLPLGTLGTMRDLVVPGPAGDMPARLFDAAAGRKAASPVLLFLHGGGWVLGDLDTHAPLCAEIARALDLPVVAIEYRLAPEHPFPAAPDD
ncbi:alpha/beta hydrolase fold domain-containing protein, partial [Bradyrhizobium diazoefficiens]